MKRIVIYIVIAATLLSPVACGNGPRSTPSQEPREAHSEKPRVTLPNVSESDQAALSEGNTEFTFELYQALREQDGNLIFSPHSISIALAMVYAGARGETEEQMAEALHFTLPQEQLHPAFNWLDLELAQRGMGTAGFQLHIANAIWGQQGYEFLTEFLDVLAENYGAGLRLLDFGNSESARLTINDWIAEQTEDMIQGLISPGDLDSTTRLVLTNAIYFNAEWNKPFDPTRTRQGPFYLLDGEQIDVEMMHQTDYFMYGEGPGYQVIELKYAWREVSMVILLPEAGEFESFESSLDAGRLDVILSDLGRVTQDIRLTMPKFEFEVTLNLKAVLEAMGMQDAFGPTADLSVTAEAESDELYVDDVIHRAFIAVDEERTEAAAVTVIEEAVEVGEPATPPIEVTIDRPFLFLIRDVETDTILFLGRVLDPSQ